MISCTIHKITNIPKRDAVGSEFLFTSCAFLSLATAAKIFILMNVRIKSPRCGLRAATKSRNCELYARFRLRVILFLLESIILTLDARAYDVEL